MASRMLIILGEDRIARLDALATRQKESRSALIRHAVDKMIDGAAEETELAGRMAKLRKGFGLWARNGIAFDPADHERRRRAEWTRHWDDDYEEVRAESPDLFDAEDDRQRKIYLDMLAGNHPTPKSTDDQ